MCMIDLIYPPKPMLVQTTTEPKLEKEKGEQESGGKQPSSDLLVRFINLYSAYFFPSVLLGDNLLGWKGGPSFWYHIS